MSQSRDEIIVKAVQVMFDKTWRGESSSAWERADDELKKRWFDDMEAALVAVGALPPKPAPTRGEEMAAEMVECFGGRVEIKSPNPARKRAVSFSVSAPISGGIREIIAAAIDQAVAEALAAHTPVVDAITSELLGACKAFLRDRSEAYGAGYCQVPTFVGQQIRVAVERAERILNHAELVDGVKP